MKLPRLRTLAVAGTLVGATLVLAAPQASAMPADFFTDGCHLQHGNIGVGTHYDFDVDGNVVSSTTVLVCRIGSRAIWDDVDTSGNPY